ncbi:MAG: sugar ABC transporter substrate-binding protein [Gluconacetobacter diazotrophicus]|nr:sugar ABC transporter substrate-binding protein [Gluconacetobacter diazotrophicus]
MAGCVLAGTAQAAPDYKVGYSSPFLTDPGQVVLVRFAKEAAKEYGITVLPPTNANGDAAKQITDIHNLVSGGAKALVVDATDSQAVIPAINFAADRNVPVVATDIPPAGGRMAMMVRSDNLELGAKACKAMGTALGGKGKVLSLMGDQANAAGRDRTRGFDDCLKQNYPNITLIERPTYWKPQVATTVAQTIVTATPDLAAIYLQSDSIMMSGVLSVLRSGRKLHKVGEPGHIFLATIDGTKLALKSVRDGTVDVVVNQPLDLYSKYAMYYAKAAIDGKTFKPGPTDHNSEIITVGDNLEDVLPSVVVTKDNVDDKSLWGNKDAS